MKPRYFMSSLLLLFRRDNASLVAFMLTSLLDYVVAGQVKEVPGTHQSMTVHAADLFYLFLHLFFCYIENLFDRRISCICQSLILYDFFLFFGVQSVTRHLTVVLVNNNHDRARILCDGRAGMPDKLREVCVALSRLARVCVELFGLSEDAMLIYTASFIASCSAITVTFQRVKFFNGKM